MPVICSNRARAVSWSSNVRQYSSSSRSTSRNESGGLEVLPVRFVRGQAGLESTCSLRNQALTVHLEYSRRGFRLKILIPDVKIRLLDLSLVFAAGAIELLGGLCQLLAAVCGCDE